MIWFSSHLVNDQGSHFTNSLIELLVQEFMVTHHKSTTYYPQGNGQVESNNDKLKQILS